MTASKVKRYDPAIEDTGYDDPPQIAVMEEYKKGEYVTAEDYDELLKENQRLKAELAWFNRLS